MDWNEDDGCYDSGLICYSDNDSDIDNDYASHAEVCLGRKCDCHYDAKTKEKYMRHYIKRKRHSICMSDQRAEDTRPGPAREGELPELAEVMINLGIALDEGTNTIEVNGAVEAINDKIDTVIDSVIELSEKPKNYIYKISVLCECGGSYVPRNKTRHMNTFKHLNYFAKNPVTIQNEKYFLK